VGVEGEVVWDGWCVCVVVCGGGLGGGCVCEVGRVCGVCVQ